MGDFVVQDWVADLPFQQQTLLFCALRGPDGLKKRHDSKTLQRVFRGSVLKAAATHKPLEFGDVEDSFMQLPRDRTRLFLTDFNGVHTQNKAFTWPFACKLWLDCTDEMPHHFVLHFVHAAAILGYKSPDSTLRDMWHSFYSKAVAAMHMNPETLEQMNDRLNDFGWQSETPVDSAA